MFPVASDYHQGVVGFHVGSCASGSRIIVTERSEALNRVPSLKSPAHGIAFAAIFVVAPTGVAQLPAPNEAGVSTGHVHFVAPDPERHHEIWTALGGEPMTAGSLPLYRFPGIYILVREGEAEAPSSTTSANHVGFSVRDYSAYKSTLESVGATFVFDDAENGQMIVDFPDGARVEFLTDANQVEPIVFHHMHLAATDPAGLRDWYVQLFGASPGERRGLPSAVVPGGRVDVLPARGAAPRGSQGAALDHIGFEVADMEAFAERMERLGIEFDVPPRNIEAIGLTVAFLTDPVGTFIEVTEGLAGID